MSSLIVLCPQCLTWIDTSADCCGECGTFVSLLDPDPSDDILNERLGEWQHEVGALRIARRGWPDRGQLLATTQGLLFIPAYQIHLNGALEAQSDEPTAGSGRVAQLLHWWSVPPWRRAAEGTPRRLESGLPAMSPLELLRDSPGAVFVARGSIRRLLFRWGRVLIERLPSRTVTLLPQAEAPPPREALRALMEFPEWRTLVSELS